MRTDIAIDKLCDIAPYVADMLDKIADDAELKTDIMRLRTSIKNSDYFRFLPRVIKKCNIEVYNILSVIYEKDINEIKEQDFITVTIPQIIKLLKNEAFRSFFTSLTGSEGETEGADVSFVGSDNMGQIQQI